MRFIYLSLFTFLYMSVATSLLPVKSDGVSSWLVQSAWAKRKKKKKKYNRRKKASDALIKEGHPSVELTIKTSPRVGARVYHGKEYLGRTPMTFKWAKDTGPLDIVVKAGGYLKVNTRIYTYRSDVVTVDMFKEDQSHLLFGYKKKIEKPSEEELEAKSNSADTTTGTTDTKADKNTTKTEKKTTDDSSKKGTTLPKGAVDRSSRTSVKPVNQKN